MRIIGLTGALATGKSTVAAMFKERGAAVIDADAITRKVLTQAIIIKKVAKTFGDGILEKNKINRLQLANIVFTDPLKLKKLTDILYPEALRQVKKQISLNKRKDLIVLDVPLLFESGWDSLVGTTIVVFAKRFQQIKRAQGRLGLSKEDVGRRLRHQMPLTQKCALADILIDNSQTLAHTRKQVDAIIDRLSRRRK